MRLEEIKGERHLCLIITFFVNALTSVVVTEQVPINTNLSLVSAFTYHMGGLFHSVPTCTGVRTHGRPM